ncbi:hypothetical protein ASG04_09985 [Curtobacterium sp. Leaf183]|nr:hypothetical protein ASG04_09985 [Curtobacterium sp. Leaf183]
MSRRGTRRTPFPAAASRSDGRVGLGPGPGLGLRCQGQQDRADVPGVSPASSPISVGAAVARCDGGRSRVAGTDAGLRSRTTCRRRIAEVAQIVVARARRQQFRRLRRT